MSELVDSCTVDLIHNCNKSLLDALFTYLTSYYELLSTCIRENLGTNLKRAIIKS